MNSERNSEWPRFYTASVFEWKPLLKDDKFKELIVSSLRFLSGDNRIVLNAFVIMKTHIHPIWQAKRDHTPSKIQLSFMRYTAQQMKKELIVSDPAFLEEFKVNKGDREYPRLTGRAGNLEKRSVKCCIVYARCFLSEA